MGFEDGSADWFKLGDVTLDGSAPSSLAELDEARKRATEELEALKKKQAEHAEAAQKQVQGALKALEEDRKASCSAGYREKMYVDAPRPDPASTPEVSKAIEENNDVF